MTLNADAASSAANNAPQGPELPAPVGFGAPSNDVKQPSSGSSPGVENTGGGDNPANTNPAADAGRVAPDVKKPVDLLSAVRSVIDPASSKPAEGDSSTPKEGEADSSKTSAEDPEKSDVEDETKPVPYARFKEVIQERNSLKQDATQYNQIMDFMRSNSLTVEDWSKGMHIMALIKNDPLKALEALKPTMSQLQQFSGEILPKDIQERVDKGFIDNETAAELARVRNQTALHETRQQQFVEAQAAQQQQAEAQAHFGNMVSTVHQWENQQKSRDPDYSAKAKFIEDRMSVLIQQHRPSSPQEALQLAQRAYSDVTESLKPVLSNRSNPVRSTSSAMSSTSAKPVPKTLHDVIRQAAGA
jgi:hypothetical protein